MQKFSHKSLIFKSPRSPTYHTLSICIPKVIMKTLGFQQNLTLNKKQNSRKATKDVDTEYMKQV